MNVVAADTCSCSCSSRVEFELQLWFLLCFVVVFATVVCCLSLVVDVSSLVFSLLQLSLLLT